MMDRNERPQIIDSRFNITKRSGRFINMAIYNSDREIEEFKVFASKIGGGSKINSNYVSLSLLIYMYVME